MFASVNEALLLWTLFSTQKKFTVNLTNTYQYQNIPKIFKRTRMGTDRKTESGKNFKLRWKMLKRVINFLFYFSKTSSYLGLEKYARKIFQHLNYFNR